MGKYKLKVGDKVVIHKPKNEWERPCWTKHMDQCDQAIAVVKYIYKSGDIRLNIMPTNRFSPDWLELVTEETKVDARNDSDTTPPQDSSNQGPMYLLGRVVRDVVSGFEGTVTALTYDISGSVYARVESRQTEDSLFARTISITRLKEVQLSKVIPQPTFHVHQG